MSMSGEVQQDNVRMSRGTVIAMAAAAVLGGGTAVAVANPFQQEPFNKRMAQCLANYASLPNQHTIRMVSSHTLQLTLQPLDMRAAQNPHYVGDPSRITHPECNGDAIQSFTNVTVLDNGHMVASQGDIVSSHDMGHAVLKLVGTRTVHPGDHMTVELSTSAQTPLAPGAESTQVQSYSFLA